MRRHLFDRSELRRHGAPRPVARDRQSLARPSGFAGRSSFGVHGPADRAFTYEVQVRSHGDWRVSAVFDDRELALHDALSVQRKFRQKDVRVVQERWCPAASVFRCRTIYDSASERERRLRLVGRGAALRRPNDATLQAALRHVPRRARDSEFRPWRDAARSETRPTRMIAMLLALFAAATALLYALEMFRRIH
jgi:hypothetical protein